MPSSLKYLFSISVDYNTYESKSVEFDLATGKLYILERYTYSKAGAMDSIVTSVQEINYDRLSELLSEVIEHENKCLLDAIKEGQGSRIELIQQDLKSYAILEKITSDNWKECIESYLSVQS